MPAPSRPRRSPSPSTSESLHAVETLTGTQWDTRRSATGMRWRYSWADLERRINTPPELQHLKVDMPYWCMATFENNLRKLNSVESVAALMLAYSSDSSVTADSLRAVWGSNALLAYTCLSGAAEGVLWVVILPLSRPVDAPTYRRLAEWAAERFEGLIPACRVPVYSAHLPARAPGYECLAVSDQPPLDPDAIIAWTTGSTEGAPLSPLPPTVEERFSEAMLHMERRASGRERPIELPSASLNQNLGGGLWPGVHLLWGRSGVGKTSLALGFAWAAAASGRSVFYYAPFEGSTSLLARLVGRQVGLPWERLMLGRDPQALNAAREARSSAMTPLPFHLHTASEGLPLASTLTQGIDALRKRYPADTMLVVLDPPVFATRREVIQPFSSVFSRFITRLVSVAERQQVAFLIVLGAGLGPEQDPMIPPFLSNISRTVFHLEPGPVSKNSPRMARLIVDKSRFAPCPWELEMQSTDFGWKALE